MGEIIDFNREQMIGAVMEASQRRGLRIGRAEAEGIVCRVFDLFGLGVTLNVKERGGKFELSLYYDDKLGQSLLEVVICLGHILQALKDRLYREAEI